MQPARTIEHIQVQLESSGAVYVHTRLDAGARVELGAENSQMREYRDAANRFGTASNSHVAGFFLEALLGIRSILK